MAAAPRPVLHAPQETHTARRERHLRLVPRPDKPVDGEERRVRETRWITALIAVTTATTIALSTAGIMGAADQVWWPYLVGGVFAGVVAFAILALVEIR